MKAVTNNYKNNIKSLGRQLSDKLYYTQNNEIIYMSSEQINSITPRFTSNLLKSAMKELELDSNINIPIGTILTYEFGVKTSDTYEYINYGNFVVYSVEKAENNNSYIIICYDKMLYAMKDYVDLGITYPITIRDYIDTICTHLNLTFANKNDKFINYDKQIQEELYLDADKNSIGYTFRDVLDELAQATASTICINNNDELEIRYVNDLINSTNEAEGTSITITDNDYDKVQDLQLKGNTSQNGTPTPTAPVPINVVTGGQEINVASKNVFKIGYAVGKTISSHLPTNDNANPIVDNYDNNNISFHTATGSSNYVIILLNTFQLKPNTQYILSYTRTNILASGAGARRYIYDVDNDWNYSVNNSKTTDDSGNQTQTFTTSSTGKIALAFGFYTNNSINSSEVNNIMIRLATETDDTYEPYNGKFYEIDLGKNLIYNKNGTASGEYGGVKYTFNEDGSVKVKGTATSNYNFYLMSDDNSLVLEPGTYTLSGGISNRAWVRAYDGTTYQDTTSNNIKTFTVTQRSTFTISLRIQNGQTVDDTFYPMLEKGNSKTNYVQHKEPIELCKIDTYQDSIKKATGKNLFDNTYGTTNDKYTTSISAGSPLGNLSCYEMQLKPSTTYTLTVDMNGYAKANTWLAGICFADGTPISLLQYGNMPNITTATFTTDNTGKIYVGHRYGFSNADRMPLFLQTALVQIEENNQATSYEPFGTGWYIEKQIGKVVLDGSENWSAISTSISGKYRMSLTISDIKRTSTTSEVAKVLSNYYTPVAYAGGSGTYNNVQGISVANNNSNIAIYDNTYNTSADTFKTWLGNNNITLYYVLATPTYTFIEDEEIVNQLESVRLLEGLNNVIVSSGDLSSPIKLTYVDDYETIDEENLKNVNVSFKDAPVIINTITLIKNVDSDAISMQDDASVEQNGLYDLQIRDNQIMSGEDRQNYLEEIFNKLNGLTYFTNDFTSIGITYLELCDRYKVKVRDKIYYCIMFNDEVVRTTGLVEYINTEELEYVKTNYVKIKKSVRKENETYIRLDEQAHEIELKASKNEIISTINLSPEQIEINSDKISLAGKTINLTSDNIAINSNNFSVDANGDLTAHSATLEDIEIKDGQIYIPIDVDYDYAQTDYQRALDIYLGMIQPTQQDLDKYDLNGNGEIDLQDVMNILKLVLTGISHSNPGKIIFKADGVNSKISIINGLNQDIVKLDFNGIKVTDLDSNVTSIEAGAIAIRKGTDYVSNLLPKVLYNDSTGTTGEVTLSETSANFSYLDIAYRTLDGTEFKSTARVYNPDGAVTNLTFVRVTNIGNTFIQARNVLISGTSITTYQTDDYSMTGLWTGDKDHTTNPIYITKVVGYR